MAIIEAYQCEVTGKKFFIKEEYENHARIIKNKQKAISYTKIPKHLIEQKLFEMRETCSNQDEINEWIKDHLWVFDAASYTHDRFARRDKTITLDVIKNECFIEEIKLRDLRLVSNIPRFNYVSRYSELPCYDPDGANAIDEYQVGFKGKVDISLKSFNDTPYTRRGMPTFMSSAMSEESGLHLGSGGGNGLYGTYDVFILTSEWPRVAEAAIFEKLSRD